MFPCRTEQEICYIGVVVGNQVSVLYTNDPKADSIDSTPVAVQGASGPIDVSQHAGRVVMLTGQYDKSGITRGEIVDVASPLLSFAIKSQLSGGDEEEEEPEPPKQPAKQPARQPAGRR